MGSESTVGTTRRAPQQRPTPAMGRSPGHPHIPLAFAVRQVSLFVMKNIHLTSVLPARAGSQLHLSSQLRLSSQPRLNLPFPWALELPFCAALLGVLALALFA